MVFYESSILATVFGFFSKMQGVKKCNKSFKQESLKLNAVALRLQKECHLSSYLGNALTEK